MNRAGRTINLIAPDDDFRWTLRRAALEQRISLQTLVVQILTDWMTANGYRTEEAEADSEVSREHDCAN